MLTFQVPNLKSWVYSFNKRLDALSNHIVWIAHVEKRKRYEVLCIGIENKKDFTAFKDFLALKDIQH